MIGGSWTHRLARIVVRPLIGTGVTPNHLTVLRLLTGIVACLLFAIGSRAGMVWGGIAWVVSAFLDRADGELARIADMMSPGGHLFDYYVDSVVSVGFFVAIGFGLRYSALGWPAMPLGLVAGGGLLLCNRWSEALEGRSPPQTRAYAGRWGFDPDDALYLMGPFAWLGWLAPILVAAAVATPIVAAITWVRLQRLPKPQEN